VVIVRIRQHCGEEGWKGACHGGVVGYVNRKGGDGGLNPMCGGVVSVPVR